MLLGRSRRPLQYGLTHELPILVLLSSEANAPELCTNMRNKGGGSERKRIDVATEKKDRKWYR